MSTIVTPVIADLGLSYSQMGFILGIWQLVYTVVAFPLGFVIDRIGTYRSLLIATFIVSLTGILRAFAANFETMALSVGLFGIGGSMISVGLPKVASIWFADKERAIATGVYATGSQAGAIVALTLTNSLMIPRVGSWRTTYLIYGVTVLVISFIWMLWGRSSPAVGEKRGKSAGRFYLGQVQEAFSQNVILVVIIGITYFLVTHGLQQWLPTILQQNGMTIAEAGFAVSMVNIFTIFGTLLAPHLPYIVGSKKLAIGLLLVAQGISVLTISGVSGMILWIVLALRGISAGFMPLLSLVLMDLPEVGTARIGMVAGLFFAIGEIGGFGGPAIMGLFKDLTGTFTLGLVFLAVVCEAMIIPTSFLKIDKKAKQLTDK